MDEPDEYRGAVFLILASLFPDIDFFVRFFGTSTHLSYHRALTNSIFFLVPLALLFAWIASYQMPDRSFRWVFSWTLGAFLLHTFMDLLNSFGVTLLFPLSWTRYQLDWVWIIDLFMLAILLVPFVARAAYGRWSKRVLQGSIIFLGLYIGFCGVNHKLAEFHLNNYVDEKGTVEHKNAGSSRVRTGVFPQPLLPVRWSGVAVMDNQTHQIFMNTLTGNTYAEKRVFPEMNRTRAMLKNAGKTERAARVFRWFARFPVVVQNTDDSYLFADLQFNTRPAVRDLLPYGGRSGEEAKPVERQLPFSLRVIRNKSGNPLEARWQD